MISNYTEHDILGHLLFRCTQRVIYFLIVYLIFYQKMSLWFFGHYKIWLYQQIYLMIYYIDWKKIQHSAIPKVSATQYHI